MGYAQSYIDLGLRDSIDSKQQNTASEIWLSSLLSPLAHFKTLCKTRVRQFSLAGVEKI